MRKIFLYHKNFGSKIFLFQKRFGSILFWGQKNLDWRVLSPKIFLYGSPKGVGLQPLPPENSMVKLVVGILQFCLVRSITKFQSPRIIEFLCGLSGVGG